MVYVINKNGDQQMPCTSAKARKLLRDGKAKVVKRTPFTIKLLWGCESNTQPVVAGMDTGSKFIGCSAIANGKVVYQSEIQIRQDISKKMLRRSIYRRARRGRKTRYRKSRWQNRSSIRKKNRLAPSVKSKIDSHLREKKFVESILPITAWKVEIASFDIHKISNPNVRGKEYQDGQQKGFYNVKAYILHRDAYKCQRCAAKKVKLQIHHIIFRSHGGSNAPKNLITLCESCHNKLHKGHFRIKGVKSKTKYATEIGIIKSQLQKQFGKFKEVFGYETKFKRECVLNLPKTHYYDGVAICCSDAGVVDMNDIVYFKKHVASGDYQQTKGRRSEMKIPTNKLFGLRKFDLIETSKGIGFVKGKRSTGFFAVSNLSGGMITPSVDVRKGCRRISARTTTLIERRTVFDEYYS